MDDSLDLSNTESLDDYLVSLATGLADAQGKLDQMMTETGSSFRYQIPQLEFELKLKVHTEKMSGGDTGGGLRKSLFRVSQANTQTETTAANTIKGTVFAVPVQESTPSYILSMSSSSSEEKKHTVKVIVTAVSGEPQVRVPVEFNIDREETETINKENNVSEQIKPRTLLKAGVVETDEKGVAEVVLEIGPQQSEGFAIVVRADALKASSALIIRNV